MGGIYQIVTGGGFPPTWTTPSYPNTPSGQISQQSLLPFVNDPDTPVGNLVFSTTGIWPTWASISGSNFVVDATLLQLGNYDIPPIDAYDGATHSASPSFTITIVKATNRPPIWNNPTNAIPAPVSPATPFTYDLKTICTDLDNDPLSFQQVPPLTLPTGWSINGSLLTINSQATNGQQAMTFRAWDGGALLLGASSDSAPITFTVQVQAQQPVGTILLNAGENAYLHQLFPVPAGATRVSLTFDAAKSAPNVLNSGALTGVTMNVNGVMSATLTAVPSLIHGLWFSSNYNGHAPDSFGPYDLNLQGQLALGWTLQRTGVAKQRMRDHMPSIKAGDVINVEPLAADGITQRSYNGAQYTMLDGNGTTPFSTPGQGRLTVQSSRPGKKFRVDCSNDTTLDGTGLVSKFVEPSGYGGNDMTELELIDCEVFSAYNSAQDASFGLVNLRHQDFDPRQAQKLFLTRCHFKGGNCGITMTPANPMSSRTTPPGDPLNPVTANIPNSAPFELIFTPPLTASGQYKWTYNHSYGAAGPTALVQPITIPTINGVAAVYVEPTPGVPGGTPGAAGQYTTARFTDGQGRVCGRYTFHPSDAGKLAVLNCVFLPPSWTGDTTGNVTIVDSEFEHLGGTDGPCHTMYVHKIGLGLTAQGFWCHNENYDGYLVKCKGNVLNLKAGRLSSETDPNGKEWGESACIDASVCGSVSLRGLLIIRLPPTATGIANGVTRRIIYAGGEWMFWENDGRITDFEMYACTVINLDPNPGAIFFDWGKAGYSRGGYLPNGQSFYDFVDPAKMNQTGGPRILDCIFAGYNAPTIPGNTTGPTDPAQFGTFFEDTVYYRPKTPIPASQHWLNIEYVHPTAPGQSPTTRARDTTGAAYRGAFAPTGLPFWATNARLQPGTWYEIDTAAGGNKPRDPDAKALTPTPGQYDHWVGFNDANASTFWQWSGGIYASAYCPGGAMIFFGGGHATQPGSTNNTNTRVVAWRVDRAQFELVALPWFEINEVLPGNASVYGNMVEVGANIGNPAATLKWGTGTYTSLPFFSSTGPCIQSDPDLGKWGEYSFGVPAATQTYMCSAYIPPCTGMPKGALLIPVEQASTGDGRPGGLRPHWCDLSKGPNAKAQVAWSRFYDRQWQPSPVVSVFCASTLDTRKGVVYSIAASSEDGIIISDARGGVGSQRQDKCSISGVAMKGGDNAAFEFCPHPTDTSGNQDIIMTTTAPNISPFGPVIVMTKDITPGGTVAVTRVAETYQGNPGRPSDTNSNLRSQWCGFTYCVDLDCCFILQVGSNVGSVPSNPLGVVLWKMKFPTNRQTGTYVWTSEVLTRSSYQAGLPDNPHDWQFDGNGGGPSAGMYSKMRYIPSVKAIAYCHSSAMFMRVFRPAGLTIPASSGQPITYALSWNAQPGAVSYRIYTGYASGVYVTSVDVGNVLTYTVTNLLADTKYYLRLRSWNGSTETSLDEIAVLNGLQVAP